MNLSLKNSSANEKENWTISLFSSNALSSSKSKATIIETKKNLRTMLKKCSKVEVRMNQNNIDVKKMRKFNIDLWKFQNVRKLR